MITPEGLMAIDKDDLQGAAKALEKSDIKQLVEWLAEKDDKIRYPALLMLQARSMLNDDVYPFWNTFLGKLQSENSYQRSIGLMLIAENVLWDKDRRFENAFNAYFALLHDEKPITVRQCIQALGKVIPHKPHLHQQIAKEIMSLNLTDIKETMRKLVLTDILGVLAAIRKYGTTDEMEAYIFNALSGGLLDKKTKKQIESIL